MKSWLAVLCLMQPLLADELVCASEGTMPILLSAPHGGRLDIPGAPERVPRGEANFYTTGDANTAELSERTCQLVEQKTGHRPFLVLARFHRRFCDANRPPEGAYQSAPAGAAYASYHRALRGYCEQIEQRFGPGLLLDVHGQSQERAAVFRGTQNGLTVTALLARAGTAALDGPDSVCGALAGLGYRLLPLAAAARENERYDGGYIVQTYGSGRGGRIDALQLEYGRELRQPDRLERTADDLATALVRFWRSYL